MIIRVRAAKTARPAQQHQPKEAMFSHSTQVCRRGKKVEALKNCQQRSVQD
jgi:phosphotransacetylase